MQRKIQTLLTRGLTKGLADTLQFSPSKKLPRSICTTPNRVRTHVGSPHLTR